MSTLGEGGGEEKKVKILCKVMSLVKWDNHIKLASTFD